MTTAILNALIHESRRANGSMTLTHHAADALVQAMNAPHPIGQCDLRKIAAAEDFARRQLSTMFASAEQVDCVIAMMKENGCESLIGYGKHLGLIEIGFHPTTGAAA